MQLTFPINAEEVKKLRAGDIVSINGVIYTARDAAHKRMVELLEKDEPLPIDVNNGAIYYVGPTPPKPGRVIGSAGPTSSYRIDPYVEPLLKKGLKVMIGKGSRSKEHRELLKQYGAVYLSSVGGAGALISETIKKCDLVAYPDLDAEAIYRLEVKDFFAIVVYDSEGNDLFEEGIKKYQKV